MSRGGGGGRDEDQVAGLNGGLDDFVATGWGVDDDELAMIVEDPGKVGRSGRRNDGPGESVACLLGRLAPGGGGALGVGVDEGNVYSAGMGSGTQQDSGGCFTHPALRVGNSQYGHELSVTYFDFSCITYTC